MKETSLKYWNYLINRYNRSGKYTSPNKLSHWTRDSLANALNKFGCKYGAEIGCREGINAERFHKAIPGLKLLMIDPWLVQPEVKDLARLNGDGPAFLAEARERLKGYDCTFIQKFSQDAVRDIPDESLDFVYIDGCHTFDDTMMDLIMWSRKVKPYGIVAGHEIKFWGMNGVVAATMVYTQQHRILDWFMTGEKTRPPSYFWIKK